MNAFVRQTIGSTLLRNAVTTCFGDYVTIFTLHRTTPSNGAYEGTSPQFLDECLTYARQKGFYFASIDELVDNALTGKSLPGPALCFTIDDGYADQVNELVPVLLRHNAKPTIFVVSNLVDRVDWPWDAKLAHIVWNSTVTLTNFHFADQDIALDFSTSTHRKESRRRLTRFGKGLDLPTLRHFMTAAEQQLGVVPPTTAPDLYHPLDWSTLRDYENKGLRIGSHGQSHFTFSALSPREIVAELIHANSRLNAEIANPSKVFCYPSGTAKDFSSDHEPLVAAAGFSAAVSTVSQCTTLRDIKSSPFSIQRIGFPQSFDKFVRYSSWFEFLRSKLAR